MFVLCLFYVHYSVSQASFINEKKVHHPIENKLGYLNWNLQDIIKKNFFF